MKTAEILRAAREAVKNGWTQDSYLFHGAVCAAGGIGVALGQSDGAPAIYDYDGIAKGDVMASRTCLKYLAHAIGPHKTNGVSRGPKNGTTSLNASNNLACITNWNDADFRTKDEVIAVFNKAIRMADRRHVRG